MSDLQKAPTGKTRILGVDAATGMKYLWRDCNSAEEAMDAAARLNNARIHDSDDAYEIRDEEGNVPAPQ